MRVSDQWLKTFVDTDLSPKEIAHTLTMAGLEVDSLEPAVEPFSHVVVAQIKSLESHPDADRLQVLQVDAGQEQPLQIVTAAKNVYQGMKVPLALVGAELVGGLKIKKSKLRGALSEGMLCGPSEIGLSDEKDIGILELPADAPIGKTMQDYFELNDWVYDIDLTPNRSDCLSMQGVARDLSALLNVNLKDQPISAPKIKSKKTYAATIEAKDACARFCLQCVDGIHINAKSPIWLSECLRRASVKSINIIVDILNFVMLETGQPMHAYDADQLNGDLAVRFANENEKIEALDDKTYDLNSNCLVVTDQNKVVGLAGIIGDLSTSVTSITKNIVIESAYFTPSIIMPVSRDFALHTEAAYRFERGVNPTGQINALNRAVSLIQMLAGGEAGPIEEVVVLEKLPKVKSIQFNHKKVKDLLGIDLDRETVKQYLEKLGFACQESAEGWQVVVPSFRVDVSQEADLVEEIARIYGYDNIPVTKGKAQLIIESLKPTLVQRMTQLLRARGFLECINYAFISEEQVGWMQADKPLELLTLKNPISEKQSIMRSSLWPGLIQTALDNQRFGHQNLALYETGLCFSVKDNQRIQQQHLSVLWTGDLHAKQWAQGQQSVDFYDIKTLAEQLGVASGFEFTVKASQQKPLHPGICADIILNNEVIGVIGQLHPTLQKQLKLKKATYLLDININKLSQNKDIVFKGIPSFPAVKRDLCFTVPKAVTYEQFSQQIQSLGGELLSKIELFDSYQADNDRDSHSWTFRLFFMDDKRTLVDDEINVMIDHMVKGLTEQFDAHLRI